jgi:hypothetical protein
VGVEVLVLICGSICGVENMPNDWYYLKLKLKKSLPDRTENQRILKETLIQLVEMHVDMDDNRPFDLRE